MALPAKAIWLLQSQWSNITVKNVFTFQCCSYTKSVHLLSQYSNLSWEQQRSWTVSKNTTYQNVVICYLELIFFLNYDDFTPLTLPLTFQSLCRYQSATCSEWLTSWWVSTITHQSFNLFKTCWKFTKLQTYVGWSFNSRTDLFVSEWVDIRASWSCLLQSSVLVLVCTYSSVPATDESTSSSHFLY